MLRLQNVVLAALLLAVASAPAWSADKSAKKAAKKDGHGHAEAAFRLPDSITLTAEQKTQIEGIKHEWEGKLKAAHAKVNEAVTPEQRKARAEAVKTARAAGKKGKEVSAAGEEAMHLTGDQKIKLTTAEGELKSLEKKAHEAVVAVLTPAQREQLPKHGKNKKAA